MLDQNSPKFIPILFQTEMIQALQKGWKTMTRRLSGLKKINENPECWTLPGTRTFQNKETKEMFTAKCPYGTPGDILWVRESFWQYGRYMSRALNEMELTYDWQPLPKGEGSIVFCADYEKPPSSSLPYKWRLRPSIFLQKEHCRTFLRIKHIRCERLRDITEEDARSEGVYRWENADQYFDYLRTLPPKDTEIIFYHELAIRKAMKGHKLYKEYISGIETPRDTGVIDGAARSFFHLFLSINPQKHMDLNNPLNNPWVWVIEFEQVKLSELEKEAFLKKPEKYSTKQPKNIPIAD